MSAFREYENYYQSTAFGISDYRNREEEIVRKTRSSRYDASNKRSYGMSERKRKVKK